MVAVTYGIARAATREIASPKADAAAKSAASEKSWVARFLGALMEARMRQAERELAAHRHLMPSWFRDIVEN